MHRKLTTGRVLVLALAVIAGSLTGVLAAPPAVEACVGSCGETRVRFFVDYPVPPLHYGKAITFYGVVDDESLVCCDAPTGEIHLFADSVTVPFATTPIVPRTISGADAADWGISSSALPAGTHQVRAVYVPGNFDASEEQRDLVNIPPADTTTQLSQGLSSSVSGQSVTLTARVRPTQPIDVLRGAHLPTGTVEFHDTGSLLGTATLDGSQNATLTIPLLGTGPRTVFAKYVGDGDYTFSVSEGVDHTVATGGTTTVMGHAPTSSVFGEIVTLSGTVSAASPATGVPTGTVRFASAADGALGTAPLSGGSPNKAEASTSLLSTGSHSLTATYNGDTNFASSASAPVTHVVNKASTTTTLGVFPATGTTELGELVTFIATVATVGPGAGTPTGMLQLFDGATPLGLPHPVIGGTVLRVTSGLAGGAHSFTARYLGDANFLPSTSAAKQHTVRCDQSVTGTVNGNYSVPATGTTCIANATITGGITIPTGASVSIANTTVGGYVQATNAPNTVLVCGSSMPGLTVAGATGAVVVGDLFRSSCGGNVVRGGMAMNANRGEVRIDGNRVGSSLQVTATAFPIVPIIGGNTVVGWLQCSGNANVPQNEGHRNTTGGRTGQCAAPTF